MSIKWDKEKIALSVAGSLAVVVIGYLVWRHEQSVAVSTIQAEQDAANNQDAELQQELAALPSYTAGGGSSAAEAPYSSGADANIESPPSDSNIAAILAAFGMTNTATTSTPTTPVIPTPTTPVPVTPPNGNPAEPIIPVRVPTPFGPPDPEPKPPIGTSGPIEFQPNPTPIATPNPNPIFTRPPVAVPEQPFQPRN